MSADLLNLVPAMPEIFLIVAAMALLMVGVYSNNDSGNNVTLLTVAVLMVATVMQLVSDPHRITTFDGMFVLDNFAVFSKVLVLSASVFTLLMSRVWLERENLTRFEYPILVIFASVGMMMMISANDLMSLYLGLELQSLTLYVMAAFHRDNLRSTEAGMKYFVLGSVASGLFLFGASLVYGFTGATGFEAIAKALLATHGHAGPGILVGLAFIAAGLAFKVSAVPFHMWAPDVYEGAPTPVTSFFAIGPKIAALALLIRVMIGPFGPLMAQWQQIIVFMSIASMAVGAFAAINQTNIKRMMAYSSIGHVGYALIGLAVGNANGIRGVLIYLAIYLFMNLGAFAVILCMRQKGRLLEGINDLAGLAKTSPGMALAMAIFMFSMAGIPPLAGFFGKFYVFMAAVEAKMYGLAVFGVLMSAVGAFYYIRIVKIMYFDEPTENFDQHIGRSMGGIIAGSAILMMVFFLVPAPLIALATQAANALFK
jgi:NADH-quinone oxidoreductase subunit N